MSIHRRPLWSVQTRLIDLSIQGPLYFQFLLSLGMFWFFVLYIDNLPKVFYSDKNFQELSNAFYPE